MAIYNGTAHAINLFSIEQCDSSDPRKLRVKAGEQPITTIPAGTNLNCVKENGPAPEGDFGVPVVGAAKFIDTDPLPSGYDLYIVSNLYRSAMVELGMDTSKLATVSSVVYDAETPRPCGCLELAVG